jgi:hypothetical protein
MNGTDDPERQALLELLALLPMPNDDDILATIVSLLQPPLPTQPTSHSRAVVVSW